MKMKRCIYFLGTLVIALSLTVCDNGFLKGWQDDDDDTSVSTTVPAPVAALSISSSAFTNVAFGSPATTFPVRATGPGTITYTLDGREPNGMVTIDGSSGIITIAAGIPAATYTFTITAANGISPNATQDFTLIISTTPVAPTITSADGTSIATNSTGSFQVTATGTPTITYSLSAAAPLGVTLPNPSTGLIRFNSVSNSSSSYTFDIIATNGISPDYTQQFTLTVTNAPTPPSIITTTLSDGTVGTSYTESINTSISTPLTWSISTLPPGLNFDSSTGTISGTPTTPGSNSITVTAANSAGSDTKTFPLTVNPAAPVSSAAPSFTWSNNYNYAATFGTAATFMLTATGHPAPAYDLIGTRPSGLGFSVTTGELTTSTGTPVGTYPFTIKATTGVNLDVTQTFTLTVNPAPSNPRFPSSTGTTSATYGTALTTFYVTATGYPPPSYSLNPPTPATGVSIVLATGQLKTTRMTPVGTYTFDIKATNGVSPDATQRFTLTVNPVPVTPVIDTAISPPSGTSNDSSYTHRFMVTAGTPLPITWALSGRPTSTLTFDTTTGVLSGTLPIVSRTRNYPLTVTATNGVGDSDTRSFMLTVNPTPFPPTITSTSATTTFDNALSFPVVTTGYPAPSSYSLDGTIPVGVDISNSGVLTTTPPTTPAGTYSFTITATNNVNPDARQPFTLVVTSVPEIISTTATLTAGGTFKIKATGHPAPVFSLSGPTPMPRGVSITPAGQLKTTAATPTTPAGGPYNLTITATNGVGTDTETFSLIVQ
ncbi:putative Ig domain-containing protein [Breznakiellaceae bacterium SP9]